MTKKSRFSARVEALDVIELICNLFMFFVPLGLLGYSSLLWLKSGSFEWVRLDQAIDVWGATAPEKIATGWVGVNKLYCWALCKPLALVSFFFGLFWLFVGTFVAGMGRKH